MKKQVLLISAVPLLLISCHKWGADSPATDGTSVLVSTAVATKTTLGNESASAYPVYWQQGDRISVNGQLSDALEVAAPVTEAEFRLAGLNTSAPYNYLYPGNASSQVTLDGTAMPMYARSNSLASVSLSHLTCGVRLDLSGDADIVSVSLSAPGGEYPGGSFSVDFSSGSLSSVSGVQIQRNVSVSLPQTFYLFFAPGTYSQGLNLTVTSDSVSNTWHFATGTSLASGKIYRLPDAAFQTAGDVTWFLPNSTIEDLEVIPLDM